MPEEKKGNRAVQAQSAGCARVDGGAGTGAHWSAWPEQSVVGVTG